MAAAKISDSVVKQVFSLSDQQKTAAEIAQILNLKKLQVSAVLAHRATKQATPADETPVDRHGGALSPAYKDAGTREAPALVRVPAGEAGETWGGFEQKRVDIWIAVDLVRLSFSHQITKAIIISGDSDLVPAIEGAKDAGVVVQLWYSRRAVHNELLQAADERFEVDQSLIAKLRR